MGDTTPLVYILHGDDEFAISQRLAELETRLGDPATAGMNTTRLDGRSTNLELLRSHAAALPFLAKRRLVIITHPLLMAQKPDAQARLTGVLDNLPSTSVLILVEDKPLTDDKELKKKPPKFNWLERWAGQAGERVAITRLMIPKEQAMLPWIQERANLYEGKITSEAAGLLVSLTDGEPRLCDQEIQKLLAYVNYRRAIEYDDVQSVTADTKQGDIFKMVDALAIQDGRSAMSTLRRLMEEDEPIRIFSMIVRQFRLLLLAREVIDAGGHKEEVAQRLKQHPFVAEKISGQARRFSLPALERVYHQLLGIDEAIKTGELPDDLALDTLVAEFTSR